MTATTISMEPEAYPFRTLLAAPSIPASIRIRPEDFQVIEHLAGEPDGEGEHVYIEIVKTGANTGWVAAQIAAFAGVREMDIGYAGRKDRHGVTRQWFSCYLPKDPGIDWQGLDIEGVELLGVTRHRSKLRRGQISCNAFELTIHHASLSAAELADVEDRLCAIRERGFPNYFGEQRFGRDNQNLDLAEQLLRQGKKVGRNRGMAISAARSWIFNRYLSDRLDEGMTPDDDRADHPGGPLTGPLIGKSRDPQPGEAALDEQMTAWVAGLRRLGAKAATRPLFVTPEALEWQHLPASTQLSFRLPAGSYATALLREVFVVEDAAR
jgi:tRNA pseudouridine13 synthase